jgi:hypothetical protein
MSDVRWLALAPDGRPRGVIDLPPSSYVLWSSGHSFLVREYDATGIPWLVRYRF